MPDQVQGQIGEWTSPTGEKIPIRERAVHTDLNLNITAALDGMILPFNIAFSTAVSQRDYWRERAEKALTELADIKAGEPPVPGP